ncbi:MAG: hypothetical protein A2729_00885 [Candidatus Buchananbacteria bacterium RIFCSPHIGHO2_01_FULL_39_14]|uniref:Uncharacterized protein n=2 Tax=Candidatus Buchananiibacteriota TaxID=1817903 RepID=A0A1G1YWL7_9BACT|nr:MAG: hypothetical protein A2729_00885 [Candidatus Buchananbacteria bacterium RIFCSPHIGHO2_01_FULL_39_14]OGY49533.1 MAG: hypothetical protein A3D39_00265 [Candidatus Buchananbacteria bacterium RIFCSPHIGHO2_02_FULL_39_17]OGY55990.1 MAG: hypothetical protein A2912_03365 [Candidatus Buchananbacteria bacterium RIFCSPLOWO2_01_FULL_40_23b]
MEKPSRKSLRKILREALLQPVSLSIAVAVMTLILLTVIVLMNHSLLGFVLSSDLFSFKAKLRITVSTLGSFRTNLSLAEQLIMLITSLLAGINTALLVFLLRKRASIQKAAGVGMLGVIGSFLGIGCASCGSVLLVSLLGITSASGFLAALPFGGTEFGLVSILLLLVSMSLIIKKLKSPIVCD